jgi:hypothetical protein
MLKDKMYSYILCIEGDMKDVTQDIIFSSSAELRRAMNNVFFRRETRVRAEGNISNTCFKYRF